MIFDSVRQSRFSELPEDVGMLIFQLIAEVDWKTGLSGALVSHAWCVYSRLQKKLPDDFCRTGVTDGHCGPIRGRPKIRRRVKAGQDASCSDFCLPSY
jgi:hypothetical protein